MSQIGTVILPPPLTKRQQEVNTALDDLVMQLRGMLNSGLVFSDNFANSMVTYTSDGSVDTEKVLAHGLGKTPVGYIVYEQDKAGSLYTSDTGAGGNAWDATNMYLMCNVATVEFKLIVF